MTGPERIQLRRTKGWRMPPNTVKVTRGKGMRWGNPWVISQTRCGGGHWYIDAPNGATVRIASDEHQARLVAIDFFRLHAERLPVHELRGKNLACWCPLDKPCHADVLLELANPSPAKKGDDAL